MRKLIIIICLGLCTVAYSQTYKGSIKVYTGQNLRYYGGRTLDSLQYILPEFSQATIVLSDGRVIKSNKVNLSTYDQNLYFIDEKNDTLLYGWSNIIEKIFTEDKVFIKDKYLMEIYCSVGNSDFVIEKELKIDDKIRPDNVGYGTTMPASSSARSIGSYEGEIISMGRTSERLVDYVYTIRPLLINGSKRSIMNKKNLLKVVPEKKEMIDKYLKDNSVNFSNIDDVKKMMDYLNNSQSK